MTHFPLMCHFGRASICHSSAVHDKDCLVWKLQPDRKSIELYSDLEFTAEITLVVYRYISYLCGITNYPKTCISNNKHLLSHIVPMSSESRSSFAGWFWLPK